jgi:serralysin
MLHDDIVDFSQAEGDRIDLAAIDANTVLAGNQAFSFIGSGAFTGMSGQLRFAGGFVQGDLNGDATADFMIHMNAPSLAAGDFGL